MNQTLSNCFLHSIGYRASEAENICAERISFFYGIVKIYSCIDIVLFFSYNSLRTPIKRLLPRKAILGLPG